MEPRIGLAAAIHEAGNKAKLGRLLGLTGAAISAWGDQVPIEWMLEIERVTGVPREILRPDVFRREPVA